MPRTIWLLLLTTVIPLLWCGVSAMAGPYSLPTPGSKIEPQQPKPSLSAKPTISRSAGHAVKTYFYTAATQQQAHKQGVVAVKGARWNCRGKRCTTTAAWATPPLKACKALAQVVGPLRMFGKTGAAISNQALKRCNSRPLKKVQPLKLAQKDKPKPGIPTKSVVAPVQHSTTLTTPPTSNLPHPKERRVKPAKSKLPIKPNQLTTPNPAPRPTGLPAKTNILRPAPVNPDASPQKPKGGFARIKPITPQNKNGFIPPKSKKAPRLIAPPTNSLVSAGTNKPHPTPGKKTSTPPAPRPGGFSLPGLSHSTAQANRGALSAREIQEAGLRSRKFKSLQRQVTEAIAAAERRMQEQMRALKREAYLSGADCDDSDPEISPGRPEVCDHKDNDCDGQIDEDVGTYKFADVDGDLHGDPGTMIKVCPVDIEAALRSGNWLADVGNDCDDNDPSRWQDCPPAR